MGEAGRVIAQVGGEVNARELVLRRTTQADDHIPQVVHGDGRVVIPSLGGLVNGADLLELSLEDIHFIPADDRFVLQPNGVGCPDRTVLIDGVQQAEIVLLVAVIGYGHRWLVKPRRDGDIGDMLKGRISQGVDDPPNLQGRVGRGKRIPKGNEVFPRRRPESVGGSEGEDKIALWVSCEFC